MTHESEQLAQLIRAGDRRALAHALTHIERGGAFARALRRALGVVPGGVLIGITGAPGAGKSSLVTAIAQTLRARNIMVGIIAVDPSSPLTGGSLLGDRIRMYDLAGDAGVFIRSMANRGQYGGLAATTADAALLMRAAGFPVVLLETVGAGQSDVAVAEVADTVLLVEAPGMGDEVQSIKAGLLEVADMIVVSKSDRADAPATLQQLRALVRMHHEDESQWQIPVLPVSVRNNQGIDACVDAMLAHGSWLAAHPQTARRKYQQQLALQRAVGRLVVERMQTQPVWQHAVTALQSHASLDEWAERIVQEFVQSQR
ncbi:MAG: hypothetical protein RL076_857 [Chloroflexota bacterium]|jgi:LAO/AO transport system kinase